MPVYTPNIPQGTTNLSVSQALMLGNFQSIDDSTFGFTKEHNSMTLGVVGNGGLHKSVTIGQTSSFAAPGVGFGTYYTTRTSVGSGASPLQTQGVYKNGEGSAISVFSAVKAWGYATLVAPVGTFVDGFNINATITGIVGAQYSFTFLVNLPSANYAIIATAGGPAASPVQIAAQSISGFTLTTTNAASKISFVILQS